MTLKLYFEFCKSVKIIVFIIYINYKITFQYYKSLNLKCENVDTNYVNNLIDCIGRKVGTVCIEGCHDGKASIAVARAIEHFHCKSFAFSVDTLSDNDV